MKASRLLCQGRVVITHAGADGSLRALVEGDSRVWLVERNDGYLWRCECPSFAYRQRCSHVHACWLIASLVQNSINVVRYAGGGDD